MEEQMYENMERYYPFIARSMRSCHAQNEYELVVKLTNGEVMLYNDVDKTMRNLPRDSRNMSKEVHLREFGNRLYNVMARKGVTQNELSERIGIAQPTISAYISGRMNPSFYIVDKIAKALDCSTDEFRYFD